MIFSSKPRRGDTSQGSREIFLTLSPLWGLWVFCLIPGTYVPGYMISPLRGSKKSNVMRILVTGGAGYIGSHAVRLFLARGHDVWVYDNLSMGHRQAVPADRLIVGDLDEIPKLDHSLLIHRIEAVVHFAAFAYVGESVTDPGKYYRNNLVNTLNLMECMRRGGMSRFVFSSTCASYAVRQHVPITAD